MSLKISNFQSENTISDVIELLDDGTISFNANNFANLFLAAAGNITITISVINTWVQATGSLFSNNIRKNINLTSDTITIVNSGVYAIHLTVFSGIATGVIGTIEFGIGINGVDPVNPITSSRPFSFSLPDNASGCLLAVLNAGDVLRLYGRNLTSTDDLLVMDSSNLCITYLGKTPSDIITS